MGSRGCRFELEMSTGGVGCVGGAEVDVEVTVVADLQQIKTCENMS